MSQDIVNPLQNTSYTSKDFTAIYTELLDLVSQLTNMWVPESSNESDPGVILVKLNAILGDKLNYNIDKNILEAFPISVTQEQNARQLFKQLGYPMHWYQSADTTIFANYIGEETGTTGYYDIPKYTMVSDYDDTIVYTILEDVLFPISGATTAEIPVMQGICIEYTTNNTNSSTLITPDMLDSNNRLYFSELNVAENGIFINNQGEENTAEWKKVDNLLLYPYGSTIYEFGVSDDGSSCYIEFPDDAEELFGSGINIHYLRSSGLEGNVSQLAITKFYTDLSVSHHSDSTISALTLNYDNTKIANYASATNGADPEGINEAYKNYKRTCGTFNTLITLRDYINAILLTGKVSNCFVCDRTNDIQAVYKVMTIQDGSNQTINVTNATDSMEAYDLKFYLLQYVPNITTYKKYSAEFDLVKPDSYTKEQVEVLLEDNKAIQHNYVDTLYPEIEDDGTITHANPCFFINKYPVSCTVVPQYQLTSDEKTEVISNIKKALFLGLSAEEIEFGEEISYDYVKQIIEKADNRIKSVNVDRFTYTTYAYVLDDSDSSTTGFVEFEINSLYDKDTDNAMKLSLQEDVYAKSVIAGNTQLLVPDTQFNYGLYQTYKTSTSGYTGIDADIYAIRSVATISIENSNDGSGSYLIKDNEAIQMYAPNLLERSNYSNNTKFQYFIRKQTGFDTLSANENYKLGTGEYIAFYWKEDSDDTTMYSYYIYSEGNVICPNFELAALDEDKKPEITTSVFNYAKLLDTDTGYKNIGTDSNPVLVLSNKYSKELSIELSTQVARIGTENDTESSPTSKEQQTSSDFRLSKANAITMKEKNEITLTSNDMYYYWILNHEVNDVYTLFEEVPAGTAQEYILENGEYFIYTDSTMSELHYLGSGTRLIRNTDLWNGKWSCTKLDTEDILLQGTEVLTQEYLQKMPSKGSLEVIENQFVTLGSGTTLNLTCTKTVDGKAWKNITLSKDTDGLFTCIFYLQDGTVTDKLTLNDFEMSYRSEGAEETISIEKILSNNTSDLDMVWKARSLLNLNFSSSVKYHLLSGQKIIAYGKDTDGSLKEEYTLTGADRIDTTDTHGQKLIGKYPVTVYSDYPVATIGYVDEEVYYTKKDEDDSETEVPIHIYACEEIQEIKITKSDIDYTVIEFLTTDNTQIKLSQSTTQTVYLAFNLPPGDYLIPVSNSTKSTVMSTFNITSSVAFGLINSDEGSTTSYSKIFFGKAEPSSHPQTEKYVSEVSGTWYLHFNIGSTTEITLTINGTVAEKTFATIVLADPYKYLKKYDDSRIPAVWDVIGKKSGETTNDQVWERILKKVNDLSSYAASPYNYAYKVPSDMLIKNPLDAKSFLNSNHVFNQFTICKMLDFEDDSIYVTGR